MKRFILSGAPGAGKTSIIRGLVARGLAVVEEAATDVIAAEHARGVDEPWANEDFTEKIARLQVARREAAAAPLQFHDRSTVCTLALARFLGHPVGAALQADLDRLVREGVYERRVFFVALLGFIQPTAARRISYADSLAFERVHEEAYRELGFELVVVPPAPVEARVRQVLEPALKTP